MKISKLIIPGYDNSGPNHWQTLWEKADPDCTRVNQKDWLNPQKDEWVDTLNKAITAIQNPIIFVAHSIGCHTVAEWAALYTANIVGALLVSTPDLENSDVKKLVHGYYPPSLKKLPFKSIVVSSSNDPYGSIEKQMQYSESWGSKFVNIGPHGHINEDSNLRNWPQGKTLLNELI